MNQKKLYSRKNYIVEEVFGKNNTLRKVEP